MRLKYKVFLTLFVGLFILAILPNAIDYDSSIERKNDILFESNTLFIITFVYLISHHLVLFNRFIKWGFILLIANQCYDIATEFDILDRWSDNNDLLHTLIKDGTLQAAYLLIAFGMAKLMDTMDEKSFTDEQTGFFNDKLLFSTTRRRFDLICLKLNLLKDQRSRTSRLETEHIISFFTQVVNETRSSKEQIFRISDNEFVILTTRKKGDAFISNIGYHLDEEGITFQYVIESSNPRRLKGGLIKLRSKLS
ncbi:hypothetical protein BA953_23225 [Vibrio coralliilyticus]|uniref:hypothetical protein n=1 Tax=Vibrio coralliilyticus TaxID=190893 RepID=UPI00081055C6|nr:hypothetical protein [Vibrio coralliilyticus]ANW27038.1 hypothetical protein BA953_23225 [Vibrio coralliilyticus]